MLQCNEATLLKTIHSFDDFLEDLNICGFTIAGTNSAGVFTLCDLFAENIMWHTECPETDPWEWRVRVLEECDDIAYAKLFFQRGGYIKREQYARFMAIRRPYSDIYDACNGGLLSSYVKRIYEAIVYAGAVSMHDLKKMLGVTREENSRFERALTELQMLLYITICGSRQKMSSDGAPYGWHSTVFCTIEAFWGDDIVHEARAIDPATAYRELEARIYHINPDAEPRKVRKFIGGLSPSSN